MNESEEPFTVWTEDDPWRIFIKCKNPDDRNLVRKKLKFTVILRGFRNAEEEGLLVKEYPSERKREAHFRLIVSAMAAIRGIVK